MLHSRLVMRKVKKRRETILDECANSMNKNSTKPIARADAKQVWGHRHGNRLMSYSGGKR